MILCTHRAPSTIVGAFLLSKNARVSGHFLLCLEMDVDVLQGLYGVT